MGNDRVMVIGDDTLGRELRKHLAARGAVQVDSVDDDFWETLSLGRLQRHDCVVTVLSDPESLLRLNQMCLIAHIDLVTVALDGIGSTVQCFPFSSTADRACLECNLPPEAYARIAARYASSGLRRASLPPNAAPGGKAAPVPEFVGPAAASAAFSLRAGTRPPARRVVIQSFGQADTPATLERSADCPGCAPFQAAPRIIRTRNRWCPRVEGIPGDRQLVDQPLRLSDRLITRYECRSCGPLSEAALYVDHRANEFDDSIVQCPRCRVAAVEVEIRDTFRLGEMMERFGSASAPVKYATTNTPDGPVCFDLEAEGP